VRGGKLAVNAGVVRRRVGGESRAVETHFKNLGFLVFKNPKRPIKLSFLCSSQNFYFFMSNSVNLFELIGVAIIS